MQDTREIVSENILGMVLAVLISVCFVPVLIPHFLDAFSVNVINTFPAFMSSAFLCVHFDLNQTWNCILPGKSNQLTFILTIGF